MLRFLLPVLFSFSILIAPATAQPPAAAPAPARPAALHPEQTARLLDILRDPQRREDLIRTLEALNASQNVPAPATPPADEPPASVAAPATPAPPLTLAPDSLGAQLLQGMSEWLGRVSNQVSSGTVLVTDFSLVWRWISGLPSNPTAQNRIKDAYWRVILAFALAFLTEFGIRSLLRTWRHKLDHLAPPEGVRWSALKRVPLILGRLILDLLPLIGFMLVGAVMLQVPTFLIENALPASPVLMLLALNTYLGTRVVMVLGRLLFSPASSHLRLLTVSDETAVYVVKWLRRITLLALVGWLLAEAGMQLGLAAAARDALLKLDLLAVHVCLIVMVVQKRTQVAAWINPGDAATGMVARIRKRLAPVWHIGAFLYLVALWVVWALEIPNGFSRLLWISVATLVILGGWRVLDLLSRRGMKHGLKVPSDLAARYPGLEARLNHYLPSFRSLISGVIGVIACIVLFQAWGLGSFDWFGSGRLGDRLLGAIMSIGFSLLVALLIWEGANAAIQRHLARLARDAQAARSARVRTLMPMLRTALLILICVVTGLVILAEIGVNIAPLLAGAGVLGIAVGFGSQKLVQDIITGLFLLLEDAMQVGDELTLGGLTGTVEALSLRTIRLRALDGSIHIIPFSAVTTVTNMTRDFAYAVVDVGIGYGEDIDRVFDVLRDVAKEMRSEPRWESAIRDDLDIMGVNELAESSVVVRVRLKTEPSKRWVTRREFNRRYKKRFDELGIEIPFPYRKLVLETSPGQPAPLGVLSPKTET